MIKKNEEKEEKEEKSTRRKYEEKKAQKKAARRKTHKQLESRDRVRVPHQCIVSRLGKVISDA